VRIGYDVGTLSNRVKVVVDAMLETGSVTVWLMTAAESPRMSAMYRWLGGHRFLRRRAISRY
jgi:hypothetical protein